MQCYPIPHSFYGRGFTADGVKDNIIDSCHAEARSQKAYSELARWSDSPMVIREIVSLGCRYLSPLPYPWYG